MVLITLRTLKTKMNERVRWKSEHYISEFHLSPPARYIQTKNRNIFPIPRYISYIFNFLASFSSSYSFCYASYLFIVFIVYFSPQFFLLFLSACLFDDLLRSFTVVSIWRVKEKWFLNFVPVPLLIALFCSV